MSACISAGSELSRQAMATRSCWWDTLRLRATWRLCRLCAAFKCTQQNSAITTKTLYKWTHTLKTHRIVTENGKKQQTLQWQCSAMHQKQKQTTHFRPIDRPNKLCHTKPTKHLALALVLCYVNSWSACVFDCNLYFPLRYVAWGIFND